MTGRPVISVIGLGRVGLGVAAAFAERGFQVIGFDMNHQRMQALENGEGSVRKNLSLAANGREAALRSEISYLIVPTPTEASGSYDLCHLRAACADIGRAIGEKPSYHLVVVASTVCPATPAEFAPGTGAAVQQSMRSRFRTLL